VIVSIRVLSSVQGSFLMAMLKTFNAQSKYGFKQLRPDGTVVTISMTGVIPSDLTPTAFREAANNPSAQLDVSQKIGKLKESGRELQAKRTELSGADAVSLFDELMGEAPHTGEESEAERGALEPAGAGNGRGR
jgi:hypothetical protein